MTFKSVLNNLLAEYHHNSEEFPSNSKLKIQIEIKRGLDIKKIHFLTILINKYQIKKVLWPYINKLLDDETVEVEMEEDDFKMLLNLENYLYIEIIE